jgi:hypothetical protein
VKYLAILVVVSLAAACGGHGGKSRSYAAQGDRIIELGGTGNRHSVEHSRFSARGPNGRRQTNFRPRNIF